MNPISPSLQALSDERLREIIAAFAGDDVESLTHAFEIGRIGRPYTDFQGALNMAERYKPDTFADASFRDYGLARAVRVILNHAELLASIPAMAKELLARRASPDAASAGMGPIGEAGTMPGTTGFTMVVFEAEKVPVGTPLYAAPRPIPSAPSVEAIATVLANTWANDLEMDFPLYPEEARTLAGAVARSLLNPTPHKAAE